MRLWRGLVEARLRARSAWLAPGRRRWIANAAEKSTQTTASPNLLRPGDETNRPLGVVASPGSRRPVCARSPTPGTDRSPMSRPSSTVEAAASVPSARYTASSAACLSTMAKGCWPWSARPSTRPASACMAGDIGVCSRWAAGLLATSTPAPGAGWACTGCSPHSSQMPKITGPNFQRHILPPRFSHVIGQPGG